MPTGDPAAQHETVLSTPRFDVRMVDLPKRAGGAERRGVVASRNAVVIVPMLDDDTVVLIRNKRFAVGKTLWECPAGTMEPGEDPAACAAREVAEETGYRADAITPLTGFFACPGIVTEHLSAFLATGLTHIGQSLDETESIQVHPTPWADAIDMIKDGTIADAKTIASLLYVYTFIRGHCGKHSGGRI